MLDNTGTIAMTPKKAPQQVSSSSSASSPSTPKSSITSAVAAKTEHRSIKSMLRLTTITRECGEKIGMTIHTGVKGVQVLAIEPNGPTARAGTINVLDMIVEINGKPTYGMSPIEVNKHIKSIGARSFTVRTYRSSCLITPHRTTKMDLTPSPKLIPGADSLTARLGRRLVFSPQSKTTQQPTIAALSPARGKQPRRVKATPPSVPTACSVATDILMQPFNANDFQCDSPCGSPRSGSPIVFGEEDSADLSEFEALEKSFNCPRLSKRKNSSNTKSSRHGNVQQDTDSHFASIRHLAKTDYSQYSRVVLNHDGVTISPNNTNTNTTSPKSSLSGSPGRPRTFPQISSTFEHFRLDVDNDVSKWIQRHEAKSEARRCAPCNTELDTSVTSSPNTAVPPSPTRPTSRSSSRSFSSIPVSKISKRARSNSIVSSKSKQLAPKPKSVDVTAESPEGDEGDTTSFQLFKYKVLLTQLEAARARRADGMDDLERTRIEVCEFIERLFGQPSSKVAQLSAATAAAEFLCEPSVHLSENGLCESSIPLPANMGAKKDGELGSKHTADVLCKSVLLQLSHVETARTKSAKSKDDLNLLRRKALIAARGVRARVVRLWARGSGDKLGLSIAQGVCHTSRGVKISAVSPESPAATCNAVFAGDVIVKVNHKFVLSSTKNEVNSMLGSPSGYITLVLAPLAELEAAFALRWYAGDAADCCEHELVTNRWLYQQTPAISRKLLDEMDRQLVLQQQQQLQQRLHDSTRHNQQLSSDPVLQQKVDDSRALTKASLDRKTLLVARDESNGDTDDETDAKSDATSSMTRTTLSSIFSNIKSSTSTTSSLLNVSQFHESIHSPTSFVSLSKAEAITAGITKPVSIISSLTTSTVITPPTNNTTDVISAPITITSIPTADDCCSKVVQYSWQASSTPIESMEQRRKDLLDMDISENDELMNEWMMLLRVRATAQHIQNEFEPNATTNAQKPSLRSRFSSLIGNITAKAKAVAATKLTTDITTISETAEVVHDSDDDIDDDPILLSVKDVDYIDYTEDDHTFNRSYNQNKGLRLDANGNWEHPPIVDDSVPDSDSPLNYSLDVDSCTTSSDIADLAIEPVLTQTQLQEIEARARRRAIATRKVMLRQQQLQKAAKQTQEAQLPAGIRMKQEMAAKKNKEVLAKDFSHRMAMMKTLKDSINGADVDVDSLQFKHPTFRL